MAEYSSLENMIREISTNTTHGLIGSLEETRKMADGEARLDPVDPTQLKGKHKDRDDEDIDNDGDSDDSDKFLHKKRKKITKAVKKDKDDEVDINPEVDENVDVKNRDAARKTADHMAPSSGPRKHGKPVTDHDPLITIHDKHGMVGHMHYSTAHSINDFKDNHTATLIKLHKAGVGDKKVTVTRGHDNEKIHLGLSMHHDKERVDEEVGLDEGPFSSKSKVIDKMKFPTPGVKDMGSKSRPRQLKNKKTEMMVKHPTTGVKVIDKSDWKKHERQGYIHAEGVLDRAKDVVGAVKDVIKHTKKKGLTPMKHDPSDSNYLRKQTGDIKDDVEVDEKSKEDIVLGMKKNKEYFENKYGDRADAVMHATANKLAKTEMNAKNARKGDKTGKEDPMQKLKEEEREHVHSKDGHHVHMSGEGGRDTGWQYHHHDEKTGKKTNVSYDPDDHQTKTQFQKHVKKTLSKAPDHVHKAIVHDAAKDAEFAEPGKYHDPHKLFGKDFDKKSDTDYLGRPRTKKEDVDMDEKLTDDQKTLVKRALNIGTSDNRSKQLNKSSAPVKAAIYLAKMSKPRKEDVDMDEEMSVHLKPHATKKTHYTVTKVGSKMKKHGGVKPGEHLSDTEVDDMHDSGIKVRHEEVEFSEATGTTHADSTYDDDHKGPHTGHHVDAAHKMHKKNKYPGVRFHTAQGDTDPHAVSISHDSPARRDQKFMDRVRKLANVPHVEEEVEMTNSMSAYVKSISDTISGIREGGMKRIATQKKLKEPGTGLDTFKKKPPKEYGVDKEREMAAKGDKYEEYANYISGQNLANPWGKG